jgi:DtxR family Mn-dependent transcriptional regulator
VMSEAVERRIVAMLDRPLVCPHGNPIPGLDELGLVDGSCDAGSELLTLRAAAEHGDSDVVVDRISEQLQPDAAVLRQLTEAGLRPGQRASVAPAGDGVEVRADGVATRFDRHVSEHVFVRTS